MLLLSLQILTRSEPNRFTLKNVALVLMRMVAITLRSAVEMEVLIEAEAATKRVQAVKLIFLRTLDVVLTNNSVVLNLELSHQKDVDKHKLLKDLF